MIYLASKSPRRRQLLDLITQDYKVIEVDIPEQWDGAEAPQDYVQRLALCKARAGAQLAVGSSPVLGSDTEVVIHNQILGKPRDRGEAIAMLRMLSGQTHEVYTAVALAQGNDESLCLNHNRIQFRQLDLVECESYCNTGEPFGKAGAYAIQGLAAAFITRLEGSYSGVMGLPLRETRELLEAVDSTPHREQCRRAAHTSLGFR